MRSSFKISLLAAILVSCISCDKSKEEPIRHMHVAKRAMYHWKNVYDTSDEEIEFIKKHKIERLYIRFFDVTIENLLDGQGPQAIPTATVQFNKSLFWGEKYPKEIVPTIFITPEAILYIQNKGLGQVTAKKILKRIRNICSYYYISDHNLVKEIQLDCDWTASTEQLFFNFCKEVRYWMPDSMLLSCTIRLHQLRRPEPPVDYGVLMLYNTNNLRDPDVKNSILSAEDVKPYLRKVKYNLPLDLAYPAFAWDLWFQNGKFRGILRSENQADSLRKAGEMIRHEEVGYDEIMNVKKLVEKKLPKSKHVRSTILYHLDENNIKRYSSDEIESFFGL